MATKLQTAAKEELAIRRAPVPDSVEERHALVQKAVQSGSKTDEARALACLRAHPAEMRIHYLNTLTPILDQIADGKPIVREIVANEARDKRKALAGPNPTPLEALLVERIVACHLQVSHYERLIASSARSSIGLDQAAWLHKKADMANRRYLSSIKTLAQVRRLQVPLSLQVNIAAQGGQQVNVAGDVQPPLTGDGGAG